MRSWTFIIYLRYVSHSASQLYSIEEIGATSAKFIMSSKTLNNLQSSHIEFPLQEQQQQNNPPNDSKSQLNDRIFTELSYAIHLVSISKSLVSFILIVF